MTTAHRLTGMHEYGVQDVLLLPSTCCCLTFPVAAHVWREIQHLRVFDHTVDLPTSSTSRVLESLELYDEDVRSLMDCDALSGSGLVVAGCTSIHVISVQLVL